MKKTITLLSFLLITALLLGMLPLTAFRTEAYAVDGTAGDVAEPAENSETEGTNFDVQGSKKASPTELNPDNPDTTVTLQLPAGEYKNEYDIVFVMDSSSSTKNNNIDFAIQVETLSKELIEKDAVLKIGIIKCRGRAFDTISLSSDRKYSGLVKYSEATSAAINSGINYTEADLKELSSGTNMHGGLKLADKWLSEDSSVSDDHKFVILLMDGKTYIWNNDIDEPTTYYTQYQAGSAYGTPAVGQSTGSYSKSAYKHKDKYFYDYTTTPTGTGSIVTVSDMAKCFYTPYYKELYNSSNSELGNTNTEFDFYCAYADKKGTTAKGTLTTLPVSNGNIFTYNIHKNYYNFIPQDDPATGINWTELKWLEAAPYEILKNEDGTYTFDLEKPNPNFYQVHPDSLQKALYLTGHLWTDMVGKYNAAAIIYNGWGSGSGLEIAKSFNDWIQSDGISDFAADISNVDAVTQIFDTIKEEILYMISRGVVTDQIPEEFTLKNADKEECFRMTLDGEKLEVAYTDGKWNFGTADKEGVYPYVVEYEDSKKVILWTINVPIENLKPVTLSYVLTIDADAELGEHDTNNYAILDYTSSDGKKDGSYTFEVPVVTYNKKAPYKVEHYIEPKTPATSLDQYTLYQTDEDGLEALIGSTVEAKEIAIDGFTYNAEASSQTVSGTVKEDGSLVLKLYYDRDDHSAPYIVRHYIQSLTTSENSSDIANTAAVSTSSKGYLVMAATTSLAGYELYKEESEGLKGTIGSTVKGTPISIDGFTYNAEKSEPTASGIIAEDGSLVLELYYDRNSYKVTYNYEGTIKPEKPSALPETKSYLFDETVEIAPDAAADGYIFNGWSKKESFKMPAADVEILGSWTAKGDLSYIVRYLDEDTENPVAESKQVNNQTFGSFVTEAAIKVKGYILHDDESKSIQIKEDNNLITFLYNAIKSSYIVNYLDASTQAPLADSKTVENQRVGSFVTESAIKINGYLLQSPETQSISIVEEAAKNVINFLYAKEPDPVEPDDPTPTPTPDRDRDRPDRTEPIDDPHTPLAPPTEEETEINDDDTPLAPGTIDEETEIDEEETPLSPFTGDDRNTGLWIGISIASLIGIVLLSKRRRKPAKH